MSKRKLVLFVILIFGYALSCIPVNISLKKAVKELGENRDTLSAHLGVVARGARDTLLDGETKRRLLEIVDSAGKVLSARVDSIKDSLLGTETASQLDAMIQKPAGSIADWLGRYRDSLFGQQTKDLVANAIFDTLPLFAARVRDSLIGPTARRLIDSLIVQASGQFARSFQDSISPVLRGEGQALRREAGKLAWQIGGISAAVVLFAGMVYAFVRAHRFRRLVNILTMQIHGIPVRQQYDHLVQRIRASATATGDEVRLRAILRDQGILGQAAWNPVDDHSPLSEAG